MIDYEHVLEKEIAKHVVEVAQAIQDVYEKIAKMNSNKAVTN